MLSNSEKITYLANLYAVARADGSISPNEVRAIEDAQKRIKATKATMKKAEELAESSNNATSLVERLSMCIANLEDMVLVALIDGVLDRAEAPVITVFAKSIGLSGEYVTVFAVSPFTGCRNPQASRLIGPQVRFHQFRIGKRHALF